MLTSAKTKRDPFCAQKSVVTRQQQSTKSPAKDVNLGTITDTLPWYQFSPLNGIRVKPKVHDRRVRIYESLQTRIWQVVKNYHGIIEQQHFFNQTQAELHNELHVEKKKETPAGLSQSGSGDKWWLDSMEYYYYLRDVQNLRENSEWTKIWRILQGHALFADWILGRRYSDCWDWRSGRVRCIRNISEEWMRKKFW